MATWERGGQDWGKGRIPWPGLVLPRGKRKQESLPWRIRHRAGVGVSWGCLGFLAINSFARTAATTPGDPCHNTKQQTNLPVCQHLTHQIKLVEMGMAPLLFPMALPRLSQDRPSPSLGAANIPSNPDCLTNLKLDRHPVSPAPTPPPPPSLLGRASEAVSHPTLFSLSHI